MTDQEKPTKARKPRAYAYQSLPASTELRLAPKGVTSGRCVQFTFASGFKVKLLPMGVRDKKDVAKVSALVAEWLQKRLGS